MAFLIKSELEKDFNISNQPNLDELWSWREPQQVIFNLDGSLKTSRTINLGNQGDDWATCIECVIQEWEKLSTEDYLQRYSMHLVFIDTNGTHTALPLIRNKFIYIPQAITAQAGEYKMVLVVSELTTDDNDSTQEQALNEREVFTSQLFTGRVAPTLYPVIQEFHKKFDPTDLLQAPAVNLYSTSLSKPLINLHATRGELKPISQPLGYLYDRFITPIEISTEWAQGVNQFDAILLYFISNFSSTETSVIGVLAYSVLPDLAVNNDSPVLIWVPEAVTQYATTWQMVMVGIDESGAEWYSNTITGQVIDNSLQTTDIDPDTLTSYLYDTDNNLLLVSLNNEESVPLSLKAPTSYQLNYTGAEVQALLDSVPTKQDQLTAGENIEITETDVINAEVPTFGIDSETGTLIVNTNKSK